jgi:hypothetical protein
MIDKHFLKHVKAAADTSPMHSYKLRVSQQIKKKKQEKTVTKSFDNFCFLQYVGI